MRLILGGLAVTAFVVLLIWIAFESERQWQDYKVAHDCKVVAHINATVGYGMASNGKFVTTIEPAKTGWQCNDGKTYYR